ncbi:Cation-independent mannose-6-phosphate receptor [Desmophyllum pertusum]|uniref:Cation-independent mannose-6-phosphate receptor n=1 Tax=Desmophyllum pertusum TaxID=174260 RepID=A0A9W9YUG5_9CNID|nr:Cation-independent mannose-6-phosphate receptor [Desmophyllum pertusum]
MRCGKFLGSPQFVDISVGSSQCVAVFEFVTNEACATVPAVPEIPCSLYDPDNKLRDLTPLIKLKGGYEVSSSVPNFDFHINVCRGITPEKLATPKVVPQTAPCAELTKTIKYMYQKMSEISIMLANFISHYKMTLFLFITQPRKWAAAPR